MATKVTIGEKIKIRQAEIKDVERIASLCEQLEYSVTNQQIEQRLTKIKNNNVLDFRLLAKWIKGAYLSVGDIWLALILDQKVRESPIPEYTHIGLTVSIEDFPILSQRIQQSGAKIWQENKSEGASLYFLDPNDHKLEIHASDLNTRIKSAKASPWEGLEFFI